ncbi:hypothetical protein TIFTF001_020960 [Ficus carica]|uniref:Uncharacterized protein n=1 Tax=Ficus carica TaxID=3494 RepID=A0AA88AET8_FICCA|nr:hypothetical protein TIFTF001_020960 [Ficus carica]
MYLRVNIDKARGKRPLEEDVDVPTNIDLEESDVEDDELTSVIRRSNEEYNLLQKKKGVESSNEASERSLLAIVGRYGFPNEVQLRLPFGNEQADTVSEGWILNEKSLGVLVNAFFPLWGPFRKELRKLPPKVFLFEAKLLAQPNYCNLEGLY